MELDAVLRPNDWILRLQRCSRADETQYSVHGWEEQLEHFDAVAPDEIEWQT